MLLESMGPRVDLATHLLANFVLDVEIRVSSTPSSSTVGSPAIGVTLAPFFQPLCGASPSG